MKVYPEQFAATLGKGLAPIYLIGGEETLLVEEAADAVRAAAREQGFTERDVFYAERGFDWGNLRLAAGSMSLFAEKRIIELRVPGAKLAEEGAKALIAHASAPPEDTVLLVIHQSLDRSLRNAKWYKTLDAAGVAVPCWPMDRQRFPQWLKQRLERNGLRPDREALALLAFRTEGNLLAAQQEADKLALLVGSGPIDADVVTRAVADSARFDPFKLVDAMYAGNAAFVVRSLDGLRAEGAEPLALLGLLLRELRVCCRLAAGDSGALRGVLPKRQGLIKSALKRRDSAGWQQLLLRAGVVDRLAKGMAPGASPARAWDELQALCAAVAR